MEFTDENDAVTVLSVKDTHSREELRSITMAVVDHIEDVLKNLLIPS